MTQTDTRLTARVLVPPTQPEPKSLKAMVLAAMCLALFMTNFDGTSGDVALPQIQRHFGSNMLGVQWFLNAYHLPVASLLLATGQFGDFYGRKKIFLWGVGGIKFEFCWGVSSFSGGVGGINFFLFF